MLTISASVANASFSGQGFWKLRQREPEVWWRVAYYANRKRALEAFWRIRDALYKYVEKYKKVPSLRALARFAKADPRTVAKACKDLLFQAAVQIVVKRGGYVAKRSLALRTLCRSSSICSKQLKAIRTPPPRLETPQAVENLRELVEKSKKPPSISPWERLQQILSIKRPSPNTS
jgi:DNA-binding transcriptional regulator YhcF (GntR family)